MRINTRQHFFLKASTPGSASVTLAQAGTTLTASQQFNYDAALTANINSVSPSSSSVTGMCTVKSRFVSCKSYVQLEVAFH